MPAEDPLAEVIRKAAWNSWPRNLAESQADAVRAHIAAAYVSKADLVDVFDREVARWTPEPWLTDDVMSTGAIAAIGSLRAALLGTTEEAAGG